MEKLKFFLNVENIVFEISCLEAWGSNVILWLKTLTLESADMNLGLGSVIYYLCDLGQVTQHPNWGKQFPHT